MVIGHEDMALMGAKRVRYHPFGIFDFLNSRFGPKTELAIMRPWQKKTHTHTHTHTLS